MAIMFPRLYHHCIYPYLLITAQGLNAFSQEHKPKKSIVVGLDPHPKKLIVENGTDIVVMPWREFLEKLWKKEIL